jgi:predicted nucleic acid-binding protein
MEFAAGREHRDEVDRDLGRFAVLEVDESVAWQASRLARTLGPAGLHIGDNGLWIAATALNFGLPVVSNNKKHFGRVPGLDLRSY